MYVLGMIAGLIVGLLPIALAIKAYNAVETYFLRRDVERFFFNDLPKTEAGRAMLKKLLEDELARRKA